MWQQAPNIIVCMLMWSAAWGFFFLFMYRRGVDYVRRPFLTAGYFLLVASVAALIFWDHITRALKDFSATPLTALGVFMFVQILFYVYMSLFFQVPQEYFEKHPNREYLRIDAKRLVSKSMDILAQQVFIILLVMFLKDAGLSLIQIIFAFTFLFAFLHIPLIVSERGAWPSWVFGGAVLVFSVIFPILILNFKYGFVYTYMIHWLFYTVVAAVFWSRHTERKAALSRSE